MALVKLCNESDLEEGKMAGFTVQGNYILAAKVGGQVYCTQAVCPHAHGYLPVGKLEGDVITCPTHRIMFSLKDGKMVKPSVMGTMTFRSNDLTTYKTQVKGNEVFIELASEA